MHYVFQMQSISLLPQYVQGISYVHSHMQTHVFKN